MEVSELFRRLSLGELSNLAIGNDGAGTILEAKKPMVILHANNGLKRLFSRFMMRENELVLRTAEDRNTYLLDPVHAQSSAPTEVRPDLYIMDSLTEPFTGDLVKVIRVRNSNGWDMALNQEGNRNSLRTPAPDTLFLPFPADDELLTVIYQTLHPRLQDDDEEQEIHLPVVLQPALTAYIASEIYGSMNGKEHAANAANYRSKFEEICTEVQMTDLLSRGEVGKFSKFAERGFV